MIIINLLFENIFLVDLVDDKGKRSFCYFLYIFKFKLLNNSVLF